MKLDIYDLEQPFGVRISALAKSFGPLEARVLSLAATSSPDLGADSEAPYITSLRDQHISHANFGAAETDLAHQAIEILDVFEAVIAASSRTALLKAVSTVQPEHLHIDALSSAMTWASFVLKLGSALMNEANLDIPQSISAEVRDDDYGSQNLRARLKMSAGQICHLFAEAVNLRHAGSSGSTTTSLRGNDLLDGWRQLWDALQRWSDLRPSELYPALETYVGPRDAFPTVLFTTPCANFSTQLYHTAALLMLKCKPRTLQIIEGFPGAVSPLWHARRICAIALSNETSEKWHPTTWASFIYAARYVASRREQERVLRHAREVLSMTKWRLQSDLQNLQEHWSSFGG